MRNLASELNRLDSEVMSRIQNGATEFQGKNGTFSYENDKKRLELISKTEKNENLEENKTCWICDTNELKNKVHECGQCKKIICHHCYPKVEQCPFCRHEKDDFKKVYIQDSIKMMRSSVEFSYRFCIAIKD